MRIKHGLNNEKHDCPLHTECAVIIASCDAYSDTWEPFNTLFERFWPECPFPVYLVSNHQKYETRRIQNLQVGSDVSWSDNVLVALSQVREEFVILMVDDLFLIRPADTERIIQVLDWMANTVSNCTHLYARPRPAVNCTDLVGPLPKGTYYRASAVSSLWRKNVLTSILRTGENAWDFEIQGSRRSNEFDGFYSTLLPCFTFTNGLIKGKWDPRALAVLKEHGVCPDTQKRGVMSYRNLTKLRLIELRGKMLELIPLSMRGKLKDLVVGTGVRYRPY